ncbi:GNAT family N-acetyltransferase [Leucobacter iarius]|uniref:GNAT family N-acetyltransferase n=1 Tax=Leucobacter iarius TaxID=333963 RepID=A0ABP4Y3M7_9MICO
MKPLRERVSAPDALRLPADVAGVTWRRIAEDDLPLLLELTQACDAVDNPWAVTTAEEFDLWFDDPKLRLDRDSAIALDESGRAVAYGFVGQGDEHESELWIELEGAVHPERRREGIGGALLDWQDERGRRLLSAVDSSLPARLSIGANEGEVGTIALAESRGYGVARWWLELERDLGEPIVERELAPGLVLESYAGNEEATRIARNESFRDHWGSQPVSEREWREHDEQESTRADLSFVVREGEGDASRVLGFALCAVYREDWDARGFSFGYVDGLGVVADARGRGIAKALLARVLRTMRDDGLERAVLDVDSESPTGAVGLYEGVGFETVRRSMTLGREF